MSTGCHVIPECANPLTPGGIQCARFGLCYIMHGASFVTDENSATNPPCQMTYHAYATPHRIHPAKKQR